MTEGVAGKSVKRKKEDIDRKDERPYTYAEMVIEKERPNRVVPKEGDEDHGKIEKVAMDIL